MRMPAPILTVMAATLLLAPASGQDKVNPPRKQQLQESAKKVRELQKERIATLEKLVAVTRLLYQNARMEYRDAVEAIELLFKAKLDAAEKQSDRITLYKNRVELLKEIEKKAEGRFKSPQLKTTPVPLLSIKARRLEAELQLEQAKLKMEQAKAEKPDVRHHKIVVTSPKAKDVVVTQRYVCEIHAQRHIKVRSLQKGYLEAITVKEGQAVKEGDVLFSVVPILYEAKWDAEKAELKLAELDLRNMEGLAKKNAVSANEVARYQAKRARAMAMAILAKRELDFTKVKAPFDGIIGRLHEQQGSLVTERDTLTTLSDNSSMWVYFNVPPVHYLDYMAGLGKDKDREGKIELVLDNGSEFKQTGKISAIDAQFNNLTGTIPFRADFPNPDRLLRHGMTGTVLIPRTLKNAIVIPQQATFEIAGQRYVYVVDKNDVAHKRAIVVQKELEDIFVISRGVGVDDRIVLEGIRQVRDGEKVECEFRPAD